MSFELVLLLIIAGVGLYGVFMYNSLIEYRNLKRNAFSQIDVQLQRRYELIPNLVTIAERYLKHEAETLTSVIDARNRAMDKASAASADPDNGRLLQELAGAESRLGKSMGQFNLLVEAYPELKADQQMESLNDELAHTENRVAFARQAYSDAAMSYNIERERFPSNIIANMFNFQQADLFEIDEPEKREPVKVKFAA